MVSVDTGDGVAFPLTVRQESTCADNWVADVELVSPKRRQEIHHSSLRDNFENSVLQPKRNGQSY